MWCFIGNTFLLIPPITFALHSHLELLFFSIVRKKTVKSNKALGRIEENSIPLIDSYHQSKLASLHARQTEKNRKRESSLWNTMKPPQEIHFNNDNRTVGTEPLRKRNERNPVMIKGRRDLNVNGRSRMCLRETKVLSGTAS